MLKRRWLILVFGFGLVLLATAPVLAHANLARSTPAANASLQSAPDEIRLWFTEPVESDYSGFSLRDSSGNPVSTPHSQVDSADTHQVFMQPGALPNGLYTVVWHAISASDGHSTNGSFAFGIGVAVANNPVSVIDESVAPDAVLIRWLNLLSLSLAVGSIGFWLFVGWPTALQDHALVQQRWWQLTWLGWIMVGISALLLLLLQVSTDASTGLFAALTTPALGDVLTHTAFGQLWFARIGLWGVFGLALGISWRRKQVLWIALLFGALLLVVQSLYSHASAAQDRAAIANDWLHLVSSSLWVGGFAAFALVLLTLRQEQNRIALSDRLVAAFSNFARVAVILLVVTGLYAAWLEVGSVEALLHTVYGQALLVKGLLFLPLLLVAAINLLLTQRGLNRGEAIWFGRLRGLVGAEIMLTVSVLLAVSVMISGNPAREVQAMRDAAAAPSQTQPYFDMEIVNNQMMHLQIIPGYVGQNQFIVTPYDENAKPITDASLIRLRFTNLDQNLGESELRPQPDGNGNYIGLEESTARTVEQLGKSPPSAWNPELLAVIKGSTQSSAKGIPLKHAYGSDFPYREVGQDLNCTYERAALLPSFALGGFSNVWGAAMLPYSEADLRGWPIQRSELDAHYAAAVGLTGLAGRRDDLEGPFPLYSDDPVPLRFSEQARTLLGKLERNRAALKEKGVSFGASRLAVKAARTPADAGCVYCGLCMYGCPYGYIYNSAATVRQFEGNPRFQYRPGVVIDRVVESAGGVRIHGHHRTTREPFTADSDRVYLAAGVIPTTRILLSSLDAYEQTLWIKDSQYFLMPLLLGKKAANVQAEAMHTLSQLFIEIFDERIGEHGSHVQIYSYNDLIGGAVRSALGPLGVKWLVRELEGRLMIAQGYLHSDLSPGIAITLTRDGANGKLVLRGETQSKTKPAIRRVIGKLLRLAPKMGALPLPPMLQVAEPGRGFHSGGTFPMREKPGPFETDVLGRPHGFQRVHAVDATVFPTIPATTITLSAMANAHRIGSANLP